MTGRSVPEWIGKTLDTKVPPRVKDRVLAAHDNICHRSGRKIAAGEVWQCDHVIALANGGENRESNLAPILGGPHKEKTAADVAEKSRIARIRKKHLGIRKESTFPGSRNSKFKKKIGGKVVPR